MEDTAVRLEGLKWVRVLHREGKRFVDACVTEQDLWGGWSVMVWVGINKRGHWPVDFRLLNWGPHYPAIH